MQLQRFACAALVLALAACGEPADTEAETAQEEVQAEPQLAAAPPPDAAAHAAVPAAEASGEADAAAILAALSLTADAAGQIVNECGDLVTPTLSPVELGGAVGTARLVAIDGGAEHPTCYGDGPDLHLLQTSPGGIREIYSARGRMLIVLPTATGGVRDIADGGPGFSFPVWTWNGSAYVPADRSIADSELEGATFLP